jgi:cell division protein FtsB
VLHLDNPAADASAAPTPARDAAGSSRGSQPWLVCSRVATFDGRPTKVAVRYLDADSYHAALAAIAALDAEERRLRAQLRDLASEDERRASLVSRLREIPRERAAHARRMAPAGEVAVAVVTAGGELATGPCTCRHARAGRSCDHPQLAGLALTAWLQRGQQGRAPTDLVTRDDASAPGPVDHGMPHRHPYVDPSVSADDLAPVRHRLPGWCYTPSGVRRPLAEALALLEDVILPLDRELARRGVSLPGVPYSAESLRRAYGASWEPVGWLPAADPEDGR